MLAAHPGNGLGLDAGEISDVAAAIRFSIGVDRFTIETPLGNTQAVIVGAPPALLSLLTRPGRVLCEQNN